MHTYDSCYKSSNVLLFTAFITCLIYKNANKFTHIFYIYNRKFNNVMEDSANFVTFSDHPKTKFVQEICQAN